MPRVERLTNNRMFRRASTNRKLFPFALLIAVVFALAVYSANGNLALQEDTGMAELVLEFGTQNLMEPRQITQGIVGNTSYYKCSGGENADETHLVLLHGARFTKEDWKTSEIMQKLCAEPKMAIWAVDLPVSAGNQELRNWLTLMEKHHMLKLPLAALVTPSASGKTMTDWIANDRVESIPHFISKWIPVAAGSIGKLNDHQLESLKDNLPIFAIYGDRDNMGKQVTRRLGFLAGAKTLEIPGGHPCYLDSPDVFVSAILDDLQLNR